MRTFSLIRHERENCLDWPCIRSVLESDDWIDATVLTSDLSDEACREFLAGIREADEPFEISHGLVAHTIYKAASVSGCRVALDGMAGDLMFYGFEGSLNAIFRRKLYGRLPAILRARGRHGAGGASALAYVARQWLANVTPEEIRELYRKMRDGRTRPRGAICSYTSVTRDLVEKKSALRRDASRPRNCSDQAEHARYFTSGLLSFAHEVYGDIALSRGVEPRSPFSDRRVIEFAVRMPVEAKLYADWYKSLLRNRVVSILPEEVLWRRSINGNPGWKFHQSLFQKSVDLPSRICDLRRGHLTKWVALDQSAGACSYEQSFERFVLGVLGVWLDESGIGVS